MKVMMAVRMPPHSNGMWNRSWKPTAAPRNSARSVAMATISVIAHMPQTTGVENCSRHISARLRPVATPSLADSDWMSIAIRLLATTTQMSR